MLGIVDIEDWSFSERDLLRAKLRLDARLRAVASKSAADAGMSLKAHRLACALVAGAVIDDADVDELARLFRVV